MKALRVQADGYAGFYRPEDVILDRSLSDAQKYETLRHWQQSVERLARAAPSEDRDTYEALTVGLAAAIECVDKIQDHVPAGRGQARRFRRG